MSDVQTLKRIKAWTEDCSGEATIEFNEESINITFDESTLGMDRKQFKQALDELEESEQ